MAVSRAVAAEVNTFVAVIIQRALDRHLSLERVSWQPPQAPNDRKIALTIISDGKPYTFDFTLTDLLLFSQGHHPKGETCEQRVDAILDHIFISQNP